MALTSLAPAAGMAGGLLGQISDVLSAPRRGLWSALGLPEEGSEAVSGITGLDKENPLAKILGVLAEVAGDPLNLLGIPLAKGATSLLKMRKLLPAIEEAKAASSAADVAQGGERLAHLNRFADEAQRLTAVGQANKPGVEEIAKLAQLAQSPSHGLDKYSLMKNYPNVDPLAQQGLMQMGLGKPGEEGGLDVLARLSQKSKGYRPVAPLRDQGLSVRGGKLFPGEDFPFKAPPGNTGVGLGFDPQMPTKYEALLKAKADQAKSVLMKLIEEASGVPQLNGLDKASLIGGSGIASYGFGRDMFNQ